MVVDPVPLEVIVEFLTKCCNPPTTMNTFEVNETAYKRMLYHKYHTAFLATVMPYYSRCHRHYVTRPLTYKSWLTLVRQVCAAHVGTVEYESLIQGALRVKISQDSINA